MDNSELINKLFSNPLFIDAQLSPDGKYLAALAHLGSERGIILLNLEDLDLGGVRPGSGYDVDTFRWIDNDHIVFHVSQWEVFTDGLYVYSVSKRRSEKIVDPNGDMLIFHAFVDPLPGLEDVFTFKASARDASNPPHLYLKDVNREGSRLIASNTGDIYHYYVNQKGQPTFALESKNAETTILEWNPGSEEWVEARNVSQDITPLGFLAGTPYLVASVTNDEGFEGVDVYDLARGEVLGDSRFYPGYDMLSAASSLIRDNISGNLEGIKFHHAKPQNFWFSSVPKQVEQLLRKKFPVEAIDFLGISKETLHMFFLIYSDTMTPAIFRLNLETGNLAKVFEQFPGLVDLSFRPMEPVEFTSGESGVQIHGYLTKPEGEGPFPTIVLVHGGPRVRDVWGFDPEVQFYALNGYAVLQVNYRGSSGYGAGFRNLDLLEVAEASVDDVIAAARWSIDAGFADPDRLAIMGGSFGGYISLTAAAREPSLWSAVVGYAGLYDLDALYRQDTRRGKYWADDLFVDYNEERYKASSPVNMADHVEAPVLIIHGKADNRVKVSQAKDMIKALKRADKSVESLFISWGVHGLPEEKSRLKYFQTITEFLDSHLSGK